jgi:hypothetical protein
MKLMRSNGSHPLNRLAFLVIDDTSKLEKSIKFIYCVFSSYYSEKKFSLFESGVFQSMYVFRSFYISKLI